MISRIIFMAMVSCVFASSVIVGAEKKMVDLYVSLALPPFIMKDANPEYKGTPDAHEGIELDVVKTALRRKGYEINEIHFVTFGRLATAIKDGIQGDHIIETAVLTACEDLLDDSVLADISDIKDKVFFSDFHITYQNVCAILKENEWEFNISKLEDLIGRRIITFQNANCFLGEGFAEVVRNNKGNITEMAQQEGQVAMLFKHRTDAVILDGNIFKYYRTHNTLLVDTSAPVKIYYNFFSPSRYKVAFTDGEMRDNFNDAIKDILAPGSDGSPSEYDNIVKKYTE